MKKRIAALVTAVTGGGLLFWRRKTIKDDADRMVATARSTSLRARRRLEERMGAERAKYAELGRLVHEAHADPAGGDRQTQIDDLLAEIDELMAASSSEEETIDLTEPAREDESALP